MQNKSCLSKKLNTCYSFTLHLVTCSPSLKHKQEATCAITINNSKEAIQQQIPINVFLILILISKLNKMNSLICGCYKLSSGLSLYPATLLCVELILPRSNIFFEDNKF